MVFTYALRNISVIWHCVCVKIQNYIRNMCFLANNLAVSSGGLWAMVLWIADGWAVSTGSLCFNANEEFSLSFEITDNSSGMYWYCFAIFLIAFSTSYDTLLLCLYFCISLAGYDDCDLVWPTVCELCMTDSYTHRNHNKQWEMSYACAYWKAILLGQ